MLFLLADGWHQNTSLIFFKFSAFSNNHDGANDHSHISVQITGSDQTQLTALIAGFSTLTINLCNKLRDYLSSMLRFT